MNDHITELELQNVHSFHAVTAYVLAAGLGLLSTLAVFMSVTGAGF